MKYLVLYIFIVFTLYTYLKYYCYEDQQNILNTDNTNSSLKSNINRSDLPPSENTEGYALVPFKSFKPENKFISKSDNPPKIEIEFYKDISNLQNIICFANDGGEWNKKKIIFIEKNWIRINLDNKFITRTRRINCSVLDKDSQWRWMGFQMVMDGIK